MLCCSVCFAVNSFGRSLAADFMLFNNNLFPFTQFFAQSLLPKKQYWTAVVRIGFSEKQYWTAVVRIRFFKKQYWTVAVRIRSLRNQYWTAYKTDTFSSRSILNCHSTDTFSSKRILNYTQNGYVFVQKNIELSQYWYVLFKYNIELSRYWQVFWRNQSYIVWKQYWKTRVLIRTVAVQYFINAFQSGFWLVFDWKCAVRVKTSGFWLVLSAMSKKGLSADLNIYSEEYELKK